MAARRMRRSSRPSLGSIRRTVTFSGDAPSGSMTSAFERPPPQAERRRCRMIRRRVALGAAAPHTFLLTNAEGVLEARSLDGTAVAD